jgi:hypothetical protein
VTAKYEGGAMTPLALVKVDAACDPEHAYLLELEPGELTMVVPPSLPRERWFAVFAKLWAQREEHKRRGPLPTCEACGAKSEGWDRVACTWWPVRHAPDCPNKPPRGPAIMPRSTFA